MPTMYPSTRASFAGRIASARLPIAVLAALMIAPAVHAQEAHGSSSDLYGDRLSTNSPALRFVAGFLNIGGYYFTGSRATRALGTPKFYNDTQLFVKPKSFPGFDLTGGLEIVSATDHFFPFQGGNEFDLIGPAFRISTHRAINRLRPFATGGLFLGRARSRTAGFDRSNFAPSLSVGVEYPFSRYVTVYGAYRVSHEIHQINTDGFSVGLKFF